MKIPDNAFAKFKALLAVNPPEDDDERWQWELQLLCLARLAQEDAEADYADKWIPYAEKEFDWGRHPLTTVFSVAQLEDLAGKFPFATFDFTVNNNSAQLAAMCQSPSRERIIGMQVGVVDVDVFASFCSMTWPRLRRFTSMRRLDANALEALAENAPLLGEFPLEHESGPEELLASSFGQFRDISGLKLNGAQAQALASDSRLSALQSFAVMLTDPEALDALSQSSASPKRLLIQGTRGGVSLANFLQSGFVSRLQELTLPRRDEMLQTPSKLPKLKRLRVTCDWSELKDAQLFQGIESVEELGFVCSEYGKKPAPMTIDEMPKIKTLTFTGEMKKFDSMKAVMESTCFEHVEEMVFDSCFERSKDTAPLRDLASYPSGLRSLKLEACSLSGKFIDGLLASPVLNGLQELSLRNNHKLGPDGIKKLTQCSRLSSLRCLNLNYASIKKGTEVAKSLAASPMMASIEKLDLSSLALKDAGLKALLSAGWLSNVTHLSLVGNDFTDKGIKLLATTTQLSNLRFLDLSHNKFGDAGAKALASSSAFSGLKTLKLQRVPMGDDGKAALAASSTLRFETKAQWIWESSS